MLPIGLLMIEHRLIEKMIDIVKAQIVLIEAENRVNPGIIDRITRFIKAYADRCHHGKEEDILFVRLAEKNLSPEHRRIMEELIEEHKYGRQIIRSMKEANQRYQNGDTPALSAVAQSLRSLVEFYPGHIQKEDKHFFIPVMDYFSREEKDAMIRDGNEFDSSLHHQEYEDWVGTFKTEAKTASAE